MAMSAPPTERLLDLGRRYRRPTTPAQRVALRLHDRRAASSACRDQIPYLWLTGWQRPDQTWRFYKNHRQAMRNLFKHTVRTAFRMELVDLGSVEGQRMTGPMTLRRQTVGPGLEAQNEAGGHAAPANLRPGRQGSVVRSDRLKQINLTDRAVSVKASRWPTTHRRWSPRTSEGKESGMLITAAGVTDDPVDQSQRRCSRSGGDDVRHHAGYHLAIWRNARAWSRRSGRSCIGPFRLAEPLPLPRRASCAVQLRLSAPSTAMPNPHDAAATGPGCTEAFRESNWSNRSSGSSKSSSAQRFLLRGLHNVAAESLLARHSTAYPRTGAGPWVPYEAQHRIRGDLHSAAKLLRLRAITHHPAHLVCPKPRPLTKRHPYTCLLTGRCRHRASHPRSA